MWFTEDVIHVLKGFQLSKNAEKIFNLRLTATTTYVWVMNFFPFEEKFRAVSKNLFLVIWEVNLLRRLQNYSQ